MGEGNFLYRKLYQNIKQEIEEERYPVGSKLPDESELRAQYGVSAITVKKAFGMLADEGYVRRIPGKGTFVKAKEIARPEEELGKPTRNPKLIGMILEHVASPYGLDMLYRIDQLLNARGYKLCVRYSYTDRERETDELEFLLSLGAAGLIIMPCHGSHYNTSILRLIIDEFPVVLIDKKLEGIPVPSVRTDNEGAVECLVEHLYEQGCRRIALVSEDESGATSLVERVQGYYAAMERLHLEEVPPCYVGTHQDVLDNGVNPSIEQIMYDYLQEQKGKVDGLICLEYGLLHELIQAAKRAGISLGRDGILTCCVDEDYLAPEGFTFTHVKQDEVALANKTVEMMLERLDSHVPEVEDVLIPALFRRGKTS